MVVDSIHLHSVNSELHNVSNVVEAEVLAQGLHLFHLPVLADCKQGQTPEEALQWGEHLGPSHSVIILNERQIADQVGEVRGQGLLKSLL